MANPVAQETSFILLLRADSEHAEVVTALASYGAIFKRTKKEAPARLELLAGLMWVHAHQHDLHVVWSAASEAQHRSLAAALHLNYDLHAKSEAWHTMIVRKVLSCIAPGATPEQCKDLQDAREDTPAWRATWASLRAHGAARTSHAQGRGGRSALRAADLRARLPTWKGRGCRQTILAVAARASRPT